MIVDFIFNERRADFSAEESRLFASILDYMKKKNSNFYYNSKILEYYGDLKKIFFHLKHNHEIHAILRNNEELTYIVVFIFCYEKVINSTVDKYLVWSKSLHEDIFHQLVTATEITEVLNNFLRSDTVVV